MPYDGYGGGEGFHMMENREDAVFGQKIKKKGITGSK